MPKQKERVIYTYCHRLLREHWYRNIRKCSYCGCDTVLDDEQKRGNFLTLDHVIPRSKSLIDGMEFFVGSCVRCNQKRGTQEIRVFRNSYPNGFWIEREGLATLSDGIPAVIWHCPKTSAAVYERTMRGIGWDKIGVFMRPGAL